MLPFLPGMNMSTKSICESPNHTLTMRHSSTAYRRKSQRPTHARGVPTSIARRRIASRTPSGAILANACQLEPKLPCRVCHAYRAHLHHFVSEGHRPLNTSQHSMWM